MVSFTTGFSALVMFVALVVTHPAPDDTTVSDIVTITATVVVSTTSLCSYSTVTRGTSASLEINCEPTVITSTGQVTASANTTESSSSTSTLSLPLTSYLSSSAEETSTSPATSPAVPTWPINKGLSTTTTTTATATATETATGGASTPTATSSTSPDVATTLTKGGKIGVAVGATVAIGIVAFLCLKKKKPQDAGKAGQQMVKRPQYIQLQSWRP